MAENIVNNSMKGSEVIRYLIPLIIVPGVSLAVAFSWKDLIFESVRYVMYMTKKQHKMDQIKKKMQKKVNAVLNNSSNSAKEEVEQNVKREEKKGSSIMATEEKKQQVSYVEKTKASLVVTARKPEELLLEAFIATLIVTALAVAIFMLLYKFNIRPKGEV